MKPPNFPAGYSLSKLRREQDRSNFRCENPKVNDWLKTKALQHQDKRLSSTKVVLNPAQQVCGFYTLVTGQIDFGDLPPEEARSLPKRSLPTAVLAWLGVDERHTRRGLGDFLVVSALRDCYDASQIFSFVAVVVDCLDENSRAFFMQYDFQPIPANPFRLFLSTRHLDVMINDDSL